MERDQPHLELGPALAVPMGAEGVELETRPGGRPSPVPTRSSQHPGQGTLFADAQLWVPGLGLLSLAVLLLCPPKERRSRNSIKAAVSGSGQMEAVSEQVMFAITDASRPSQLPSPCGSAGLGLRGTHL